ncbi:acid phosphatase type 7 isoform X6 [Pectinophora gossypiella]|uniref:acid phosphatase type 7 isoform X6 n=1 Tax=Pectinophora gossypiella TaxID=13191 RepID=UPI00214F5BE5|nr:acid phosphatase type 7 isoform X6 [Pectinophora gossypiella]
MKLLVILLSLGIARANRIFYDSPPYDCGYCQPEQIHISFGEKTNDIVVTWTTYNDTEDSMVQYGEGVLQNLAMGYQTMFVAGNGTNVEFVHRVTLPDLKFDTRYVYHCGSKYAWSERFSFKTPPSGENWVVRAAIFGDMGTDNAHSLPYLQDEAERDRFDMILHVGDFAYDMYEVEGRNGDQFMRQIQPLAAIVPYMTVPGNHEENGNFRQYKQRFSMPNMRVSESMYYSWDLGPVHFVGVNTEAYYFLNYGLVPLIEQFQWLEQDLKMASRPENRAVRPWIVLYGHRPMYCSNSDDIDCSVEYTRKGLPFLGVYSMEPLLRRYGVDVVIWAHEHSYERTFPLYDEKVYNGSYEHPYVNPRAPVHIITGSAGCREGRDHFKHTPHKWSAFHSQDYGYTRFKAYNKTHINIEQVSVDLNGQVIDAFWIVKNKLSFNML